MIKCSRQGYRKARPSKRGPVPKTHTCNKITGAPENKTSPLLHSDNMQVYILNKNLFKLKRENKKQQKIFPY